MEQKKDKIIREKPIPEEKKKNVEELAEKMQKVRTVLIASCKSLPSRQFHEIKKRLRGKAEMKVAKKSSIVRAIDSIEKGAIKNLKKDLGADIVIFFSDIEPFELSALLSESQSPAKAKAGDIAPEDIKIEPGSTDLIPGPAISELGSVGLKVTVKEGKLEIMQGAVVVKKGEKISEKVSSVLAKLGITPMKVGFVPLLAYDAKEDKIYSDIKIDKEETLEELKEAIKKALGFAVNINYPTKETILYFISKASVEEKALEKLIEKKDKKENSIEEQNLNSQKNEDKKEKE